MDISEALDNREMGQVPVSIATSLALEGAGGVLEDAPVTPAPIVKLAPRELWVNLRTLFRNFYGSVERSVKDSVVPDQAIAYLSRELELVQSAVNQISNHKTRTVFYFCTHDSLQMEFPRAKVKVPKTDNQLQYAQIERDTCAALVEMMKDSHEYRIETFDVHLTRTSPSAFILTHMPVDLLSRRFFSELWLLESHTGKIKPAHEWSSKLTGGKGYERIPFNRFTLQVFGDDSTTFYAMPIKIKRFLVDLAKKKRWHPKTTKDKILHDIKFEHEPGLLDLARDLFSTGYR